MVAGSGLEAFGSPAQFPPSAKFLRAKETEFVKWIDRSRCLIDKQTQECEPCIALMNLGNVHNDIEGDVKRSVGGGILGRCEPATGRVNALAVQCLHERAVHRDWREWKSSGRSVSDMWSGNVAATAVFLCARKHRFPSPSTVHAMLVADQSML